MTVQSIVLYMAIGIIAGIASGMFGIGGGFIIIPALVYAAGYSQFTATGTSLAVLLPPIGLAATIEYWRRGHVNFQAAFIIALCMLFASWAGAWFTRKLNGLHLRFGFGIFLTAVGLYIAVSTLRKIRM
ncbi:MAG: sulfite exporter TauE/SafE family protein [Chitinispirillaceae bacterium]|nr:sulfite exporter TauE/SafE family protein [Chitinispirillaceae bacterium]